jgi:hypothetical protein
MEAETVVRPSLKVIVHKRAFWEREKISGFPFRRDVRIDLDYQVSVLQPIKINIVGKTTSGEFDEAPLLMFTRRYWLWPTKELIDSLRDATGAWNAPGTFKICRKWVKCVQTCKECIPDSGVRSENVEFTPTGGKLGSFVYGALKWNPAAGMPYCDTSVFMSWEDWTRRLCPIADGAKACRDWSVTD